MLYQGEDITIKIGGDDIVNFVDNDFVVYIYPYDKSSSENIVFKKSEFVRVGAENAYLLTIPYEKTKKMCGAYCMEILIIDAEGGKRSIYRKDGLFTVEHSRIGDYN